MSSDSLRAEMDVMDRVEQLERFLEQDPGNPELICDLLDNHMASGAVQPCIDLLAKLSDSLRREPGICFREARLAMVQARFDDAAGLLQSLLDSGTDVWAIRHDLALTHSHQGNVDAALSVLSPLLSQQAVEPAVRILHARLLYSKGEIDEALQATEEVLRTLPDQPDAQGLRALLLLDRGDTAVAREAAERCLSIHPKQTDAMLVAGTLALWEQRLDVAQSVLGEVSRNTAFAGRALSGLGQVHMVKGDLSQATQTLQHAIEHMPNHIGTWHALAWCQLLSGDVIAALHSLEQAFALDRSFGETHGGFAIVHVLHGRREEAEAAVRRAQRLDPNGRSFLYAKALLLRSDGRKAEAEAIVASVIDATPGVVDQDPSIVLDRLTQLMQPDG